jgi:hypothetical protein
MQTKNGFSKQLPGSAKFHTITAASYNPATCPHRRNWHTSRVGHVRDAGAPSRFSILHASDSSIPGGGVIVVGLHHQGLEWLFMTSRAQELLREALALPLAERADVAAELLASLDDAGAEDPAEVEAA